MFAGKNLKWHKKASHPDSIKKKKKIKTWSSVLKINAWTATKDNSFHIGRKLIAWEKSNIKPALSFLVLNVFLLSVLLQQDFTLLLFPYKCLLFLLVVFVLLHHCIYIVA